jgi:hypothetical protein
MVKKNEPEKAFRYYNDALEIWKKIGDEKEIAIIQNALKKLRN